MDDMSAYYPPPGVLHYPYYPPPPPPPPPPQQAAQPPIQPYIPQQQSPFTSYDHSYASYSPHDQVRTLFIAGLPEDVKQREIYNLFREFPGYESSHLRTPSKTSQPFAFAVFYDQHTAVAAMHALNGMVFDLEKGSTLYIDLAKSNSRLKRSRTDSEWPNSDKIGKGSAISRGHSDSGFGSAHVPGMGISACSTIRYTAQSSENYDGRTGNDSAAAKSNHSAGLPCPTIFVANLGPTCTEQELIQVFSRFPGFLKLKMQSTYGPPVAFVDFQDTSSSTEALNHLQGTILYSSPPGGEGMRLEYAKSRMGMRRKPK